MRRALLLYAGPLAALVPFVVGGALIDVPDPVATHWDGGATPDGSTPLAAFVAIVLVAWAAGAVLPLVQARRRHAYRLTAAPYGWALQWFASGLGVLTLTVNDGAARWQDAGEVGFGLALVPVLAGGVAALVAMVLEHGRAYGPAPAGDGARPTVGLRPGERAMWSRHLRSRPATVAAALVPAALAVAAIGVAGDAAWPLWFAAVVTLLAFASVSELDAIIGERGLTVTLGPLGLPRRHVAVADIAWAERLDVDPWRWGGWGWRKVPRRRATAIVVRAGDGIRVGLRDGRELVVTVPDAATAAGLLNDLATRAPEPDPFRRAG